MIYYTIVQTDVNGTAAQKAELISREMYKMSRPNPHPEDVTLYLFPWYIHPNTMLAAIYIDDEYNLPIATNSNQTMLLNIFGLVATQAEIDALNDKINNSKGDIVQIKDVLPQNITKLTEENLINMGFFPEII